MASVLDVAEAVLREQGQPIDTFRLQKLVYYCQAYHLAKHGSTLFPERIEAWTNGPAVPRLYREHRGSFRASTVGGNAAALTAEQAESVRKALALYGGHTSEWLVTQTHIEAPWKDARIGLAPNQRGNRAITTDVMRSYYTPILNDAEAEEALARLESDPGLTPSEIRDRYRV